MIRDALKRETAHRSEPIKFVIRLMGQISDIKKAAATIEVTNGNLYAYIGSLAQASQYPLCDLSDFIYTFASVKCN